MRVLKRIILAIVIFAACVLGIVYSGVYNIAADEPNMAAIRMTTVTIIWMTALVFTNTKPVRPRTRRVYLYSVKLPAVLLPYPCFIPPDPGPCCETA